MHVVWLHGRSYYDQVMIYLRKAIPMAASSFSSKTFNIRTQIRIDQASELGKKNSCHAYNIWNTRHVRCCCRITHTAQTMQDVDWWYKNVEKIFRKKNLQIYTVHCNSLEPCVSKFAVATAGILANRSYTQCMLWGIWTVIPSANSTGTQHHGRGEERRGEEVCEN